MNATHSFPMIIALSVLAVLSSPAIAQDNQGTGGPILSAVNLAGSAMDYDGIAFAADDGMATGQTGEEGIGGNDGPNGLQVGLVGTPFASVRWAPEVRYSVAAPSGPATLDLYFMEGWYSDAGRRIMSIEIEGQVVRDKFDIVAASGGDFNIPQVLRFSGIDPTAFGDPNRIEVRVMSPGDNAVLSAVVLRCEDTAEVCAARAAEAEANGAAAPTPSLVEKPAEIIRQPVSPESALATAGLTAPTYESVLSYYLAGKTWLINDPEFLTEYGKLSNCAMARELNDMNEFQRQRALDEFKGAAQVAVAAAVTPRPQPLTFGLALFDKNAKRLRDYDFENQLFNFKISEPGETLDLVLFRDSGLPKACTPNHPELPKTLALKIRGTDIIQRLNIPLDEAEALFNEVGDGLIGTILTAQVFDTSDENIADRLLGDSHQKIPSDTGPNGKGENSFGATLRGEIDAIVTDMTLYRLGSFPRRNQRPIFADFQQELLRFDQSYFIKRYAEIREQEKVLRASLAAFEGPDGPVRRNSTTLQLDKLVNYGRVDVRSVAVGNADRQIHLDARNGIRRLLSRSGIQLPDHMEIDDLTSPTSEMPESIQTLVKFSGYSGIEGLAMVRETPTDALVYCQVQGGTLFGGGGETENAQTKPQLSGKPANYPSTSSVVESGKSVIIAPISDTFERIHLFAMTEMKNPNHVRICPYHEMLSSSDLSRLTMQGIDIMAQDICRDFVVDDPKDWRNGVKQTMDFPAGSAVIRDVEVTCRRGGSDAPAGALGRKSELDHVLVSVTPERAPSSIHDLREPLQGFITLPRSAGENLPWIQK